MKYYQMKFNPLNNEYQISNLNIKGVDRSKMKADDILKWSSNLWICTSKKRLESFAQCEIERKIKEYTELLEKTKNRVIRNEVC